MRFVHAKIALAIAIAIGAAFGTGRVRAANPPRTVEIHAKRYSFDPPVVTLKRGETVKLLLTSEDRTHGFFVRALGIDADIPAGRTTEVTVTPTTAGTFTTICDHYCGLGHNGMKMKIVVQ
jgi:cytochrome c oxidase subunit II